VVRPNKYDDSQSTALSFVVFYALLRLYHHAELKTTWCEHIFFLKGYPNQKRGCPDTLTPPGSATVAMATMGQNWQNRSIHLHSSPWRSETDWYIAIAVVREVQWEWSGYVVCVNLMKSGRGTELDIESAAVRLCSDEMRWAMWTRRTRGVAGLSVWQRPTERQPHRTRRHTQNVATLCTRIYTVSRNKRPTFWDTVRTRPGTDPAVGGGINPTIWQLGLLAYRKHSFTPLHVFNSNFVIRLVYKDCYNVVIYLPFDVVC